jgi:hypothetical protein
MSLENAYSNVPRRGISTLSSGGRMPMIEKDQTINKLTNDVFSQMEAIDKKDNPIPDIVNSSELKTFSFEDAIKELHSIVKKGK